MFRIFLPAFVLILSTLVFYFTPADFCVQDSFYKAAEQGWYLKGKQPWKALYDFGNIPSLVCGVGALLILIIGWKIKKAAALRRKCVFTLLLLLLGPGLIVNVIFKDYWGRPRPSDIIRYGGNHEYVNVLMLGDAGKNSSFPSGHASMGFYLMFPYFLYANSKRTRAFLFLWLGIIYGCLMGMARIIQGGHFLSDVLWAWGFVYFTGIILNIYIKPDDVPVNSFLDTFNHKFKRPHSLRPNIAL